MRYILYVRYVGAKNICINTIEFSTYEKAQAAGEALYANYATTLDGVTTSTATYTIVEAD